MVNRSRYFQKDRGLKVYTQSKVKNAAQEILELIASKKLQLHEAVAVVKKVKKSLKNGECKGDDGYE